jgi:hypothetical protein
VVADIENGCPGESQILLDLGRVATEVGARARDRTCHRLQQARFFVGDREEGQVVAEEARLARTDNDQLEEIPPGALRTQVSVVGEGHDLLHVRPLRVRDQHQALARLELIEQRLRCLRVGNDVGLRVGHDVGLEGALDVGHVEPLADVTEEVLVAVDLGRVGRRGPPTVRRNSSLRAKTGC